MQDHYSDKGVELFEFCIAALPLSDAAKPKQQIYDEATNPLLS